jgi:hypothetical protein
MTIAALIDVEPNHHTLIIDRRDGVERRIGVIDRGVGSVAIEETMSL